jgi:hypothetical protein
MNRHDPFVQSAMPTCGNGHTGNGDRQDEHDD